MKKRISALLCVLLTTAALLGCGKEEIVFTSGHVSARTYENPQLGLMCIVPADWDYLNEGELLQLSDVVLSAEGGEKDVQLNAHLNAGGNVQDMYVMTKDGLRTINVMVRRLDLGEEVLDIAAFADQGSREVEAVYTAMGITEVEVQRQQTEFLDDTCETIRLSGAYADVPLYSLQLCMERGPFVCVVTFTSYVEDMTGTMMKFFHPLVQEAE